MDIFISTWESEVAVVVMDYSNGGVKFAVPDMDAAVKLEEALKSITKLTVYISPE